jgi:hypothetical protein
MKYTEEIDQTYKAMYEAALEMGDTTYAARIKKEWDDHRRIAQTWEGTSDAIRVTVSAKGSGDWWDRWRGWEDVSADLQAICIAPANLRDQVEKRLGFNAYAAKSEEYIALENDLPADVYGLAQPLPKGQTACTSATGMSSRIIVDKALQKNVRINEPTTNPKNQGMCIVFGKTKEPGYADFTKACIIPTAALTKLTAVPTNCFVN